MGGVPEAQVEFSRNEDAARQHDDLVQFVDYRRLADARVARDQNELRAAMHHDAVERGKQGGDLAVASCRPGGNGSIRPIDSQAVRHLRRSASTPAAVW